MPHVVYLAGAILCPWLGCGYRIELVDFQLELAGDTAFYAKVLAEWGQRSDFGLVGRCPGCGHFVLFGLKEKKPIDDPSSSGLPVLPDNWHLSAYIA
jgi:hypothetical protein